jgi:hypothetical protein
MAQLSLFDDRPAPPTETVVPAETIRKFMIDKVRTVKAAQFMPWPEHELRKWDRLFVDLLPYLPGEGEEFYATFTAELERLRKVEQGRRRA